MGPSQVDEIVFAFKVVSGILAIIVTIAVYVGYRTLHRKEDENE